MVCLLKRYIFCVSRITGEQYIFHIHAFILGGGGISPFNNDMKVDTFKCMNCV